MAEYIEKAALEKHLKHRLFECAMNNDGVASKVFAECAENRVPGWLSDAPLADVIPRSETCPYYVYNKHDRGNDSICRKAGCKVEDMQHVVYGTWLYHRIGNWIYAECSECKTVHYVKSHYCPNCGTEMRKELENG